MPDRIQAHSSRGHSARNRDIRLIGKWAQFVPAFRSVENANIRSDVAKVRARAAGESLFYRVFLPLGVVANLGLGVFVLIGLRNDGWPSWLEVGTGALCCFIGGWLAAAAWSRSYWNRAMAVQIRTWRQIADTFFFWLEDAPLPAESLHKLKTSLDEVVPDPQHR
jgi:protein-S-isoprenylcysteine O-methyltransferase Ste14